ncbi:alpha-amylase family glycosyl hydrolase [Catenovulum sp. 2E275]|uniref:alpha-amylase family glycosyl hydrolase n=1 Tax=Catenovulum sp. 2E275 TaxID=2980497 RepID=UPI0021D1D692|nr:alpha-amylase family glycosyl hydrolase [Catenovulum sp. 2E275]MCU4676575.1 alpha-amylase family glycosyl hydrolase [Catenovulum sp. 2E275]
MLKQNFITAVSLAVGFALTGCGASKTQPTEPTSANQTTHNIYQDYLNRDVRDDIFYFVLPDRFENGDKSNDLGDKNKPISYGGFKPDNKAYYHGGDLKGLEQKLDYLENMGITAIWMTPILRNRAVQGDSSGYHGYWIVDFSEIDPHLGGNKDLKSLIDKAHQRGIKVFFDIITNHTADVIRYRECHDEQGRHLDSSSYECKYKTIEQTQSGDKYTPFIPKGQETVKTPAWLNDPKYYNNQGDSFWQGESAVYGDFSGLDDLDTRQQAVVDGFIDIYKHIVSEFKPDGFRVDTVKHVDMSFWQVFSPAIMEHAHKEGIPNFHIFGEVYDGDPAFLSRFTTVGKMPAILDFGLQGNADDVFANHGSPQKLTKLFDDDDYYNDEDSSADELLTFIGNHDMGRIGLFLNNNFADASEAEKTQRSILTHAFMYFARGIPVVYYGDEQGFTGDGNDQAARENMMPSLVDSYNDNNLLGTDATTADDNFDESHVIYQSLAEFAKVYKQNTALRRGIHLNRFADKASGLYAFSRIDTNEQVEYLLAFNSAKQPKTLQLAATSAQYKLVLASDSAKTDTLKTENDQVNLTVPPLGFVIYKADSQIIPANLPSVAVTQAGVDERVSELFNIEYRLGETQTTDAAPALLKVTTEYMTKDGEFKLAATDFTPPYRAKIDLNNWQQSAKKVRVTVDNLAGKVKTKLIDLSN